MKTRRKIMWGLRRRVLMVASKASQDTLQTASGSENGPYAMVCVFVMPFLEFMVKFHPLALILVRFSTLCPIYVVFHMAGFEEQEKPRSRL